MVAVNIAQLKNQLSSLLKRVRAGEELIIKDRNIPIARVLPLREDDFEAEEMELVAAGLMTLPKKKWDPDHFFSIGRDISTEELSDEAIRRALAAEKEDWFDSFLGHKRNRSHLRSRPKK